MSNETAEHLFSAGPCPAWVQNASTQQFMRVNDAAVQLYGYSPDEFTSLTLRDLAPDDLDGRHRTRDGRELDVVVWSTPIRHEECAAHLSIVIDVTMDRRAAERERLAMQREYEAKSLDATGRIAGGVAHHFNNILTAVRGYTELARSGLAASDPAQLDLQEVCLAVDRATALTGELVAFSGRQVLRPELMHIPTALAEMEPTLRNVAGERIVLAVRADPGLCAICVDRQGLTRAMLNLVTNACEAMVNGGTLVVRAEDYVVTNGSAMHDGGARPGRYAAITVEDDGHGMSPDVLARAIDPFFTTKPVGQGAGLGLSMVHGFLGQSGGYVGIESLKGRGTRVRLWLPAALGRVENNAFPSGPYALQSNLHMEQL